MTTFRTLLAAAIVFVGGCDLGPKFEPRRLGETCEAFEDCATGLICAHDGVCRASGDYGTVVKDQPCLATSACRIGLVCSHDGVCTEPDEPGTTDRDGTCGADDDCQFGLTCQEPYGGGDTVCKGLLAGGWIPEPCPEDDEDEDYRVYFEVPDGAPAHDFYRMPFPSDALVDASGRISLEGHPVPPFQTLAEAFPDLEVVGDVVGRLIDKLETDTDGRFGNNQAVFFRFSQFPETRSIRFGLPGNGNISIVDITAWVDDRGELPDGADQEALEKLGTSLHPFRYEVSSSETPYICQNWIAMHPLDGRPFAPGHTYAAILGTTIELDAGTQLVQDADFAAMLGDSAPADTRLQRAWDSFAPFRAWLAARAANPTSIAAATVFTVQDTTERPQLVYDAVQNADAPVIDPEAAFVACGDGDDPFAVAGDDSRGCSGVSGPFEELQALASLPQFQKGTPPYKDAADGGGIDTSAGPPTAVFVTGVNVAITIPTGAEMPPEGWPLVLYGHGTGGSYTSFLRNGFAAEHTEIDMGDETVHLAMMSFDAPMHGPRAFPGNWKTEWLDIDPSAYDPDILFFNPLNLTAARDNALQQAADLWSLVRLAGDLDIAAEDSPTGEAIRFDMTRLYYVGHSQGGVTGVMFAAYEPELDGLVLSGAGGVTINALLEKKKPNDIPAALRVGLVDVDISRVHPVLNLGQMLAEASDGVNHAVWVMKNPFAGADPVHTFQSYGIDDSYTPDSTQLGLARALGMQQVPNGNTPLDTNRYPEVTLPASANGPRGATAVMVQYSNAGDDAHYVIFDRDDAKAHISSFLGSAVLDGVPTVSPAP